jgi:hypothetical protein
MGAEKTNKQTISCVSTEQREIVSDMIIHVNVQVLFDRGWTYYWWGSLFIYFLFFLYLRPETTREEVENPSNWNQQTNTTIQQHGVCQPTAAQALSDRELDTVLWKVDMF